VSIGLAACLALMLAASTTRADFVTFNATNPIAAPGQLTNFSHDLLFPKFDPSLGTLTSVQVELTGQIRSDITISSSTSANGNVRMEVLYITSLGGDPFLELLGPRQFFTTPPSPVSFTGVVTGPQTQARSYSDAPTLVSFTGSGNYTLSVNTLTQTLIAFSSGNAIASQTTTASLNGNVRYTFTPVPEPGSIALTLIGLLGLAAIPSRRMARAR
jgi:hypothetical protein